MKGKNTANKIKKKKKKAHKQKEHSERERMVEQEGHSYNEKEDIKKLFRNTQNQVIFSMTKICR